MRASRNFGEAKLASLTTWRDEALIVMDTIADRAQGLVNPSIRLGVTGLSRAGKTVFIAALVHNLLHGGRLPMFEARRSGRISRIALDHQPDDAVPRFQYEEHVRQLVEERLWPDSTRAISELRLVIDFEPRSRWSRMLSAGRMALDIVDYPGEWLLDLPLLGKSYREFSDESLALANEPGRADVSGEWRALAASVSADAPFDERDAARLAAGFTAYLRACKADHLALSTLPPGRFLMPGDLEGSPALTFAPLPRSGDGGAPAGSLHAMFERRYEAYKTHVVRPFFREHVARLDRQIVLIDAMQALNAGSDAVADLERALGDILTCFRPGGNGPFTAWFRHRIDRVLIAATKADHIHHDNHDRLERLVRRLVEKSAARVGLAGARVETLALAAVRATREGTARHGGETLPVIIGTPISGEEIGGDRFDGRTETAIFPGDLAADPESTLQQGATVRFVRFRPPKLEHDDAGRALSLPHIRLDRAIEYLIGDRLA